MRSRGGIFDRRSGIYRSQRGEYIPLCIRYYSLLAIDIISIGSIYMYIYTGNKLSALVEFELWLCGFDFEIQILKNISNGSISPYIRCFPEQSEIVSLSDICKTNSPSSVEIREAKFIIQLRGAASVGCQR